MPKLKINNNSFNKEKKCIFVFGFKKHTERKMEKPKAISGGEI